MTYAQRVRKLEGEGLTTSDAQSMVDCEDQKTCNVVGCDRKGFKIHYACHGPNLYCRKHYNTPTYDMRIGQTHGV